MKRLLLKIKKLLSINIIVLLFCICANAQERQKAVITGDLMEVRNNGSLMISKGNSKAVSGKNTIKANEMRYDKDKSTVDASGNVRLYSTSDDNEPIEVVGKYANYNLQKETGKLWGEDSKINYYIKDSSSPIILKAKEIHVDMKLEEMSAFRDVVVITSSGVIHSDNAIFKKKQYKVELNKTDEKRPTADVVYDGRKGFYEADKMIFINSKEDKSILMTGNVVGKIEMEDKIK